MISSRFSVFSTANMAVMILVSEAGYIVSSLLFPAMVFPVSRSTSTAEGLYRFFRSTVSGEAEEPYGLSAAFPFSSIRGDNIFADRNTHKRMSVTAVAERKRRILFLRRLLYFLPGSGFLYRLLFIAYTCLFLYDLCFIFILPDRECRYFKIPLFIS